MISDQDFLAPYLLSSIDRGAGMIRMLNETPIDYVTWGNHEADLSHNDVMCRVDEYKGVTWLQQIWSAAVFSDVGQSLNLGDVGSFASEIHELDEPEACFPKIPMPFFFQDPEACRTSNRFDGKTSRPQHVQTPSQKHVNTCCVVHTWYCMLWVNMLRLGASHQPLSAIFVFFIFSLFFGHALPSTLFVGPFFLPPFCKSQGLDQ